MFVYHYRIFDRYDRVVVSLAILGDDRPSWRPNKFEYNNWGCKVEFEFPAVKLLDYAGREEELAASSNVFATVVLAHLKALETRGDVQSRRSWKLRIVRALYERGWESDDVRKLFAFIDWLIDLPKEIERGFLTDVFAIEKEKQMPFVTNAERFGMEKGIQIGRKEALLEGIELALELKFGSSGLTLLPEIRSIQDVDRLSAIHRAIKTLASVEGLRALVAAE